MSLSDFHHNLLLGFSLCQKMDNLSIGVCSAMLLQDELRLMIFPCIGVVHTLMCVADQ
jgi:hypothetical protein